VGYFPAEILSGDFYNVFRIDAKRFGICIGDVAGHGVSAAMLTVFAFQSVQSLQDEPRGAGVILPSFVLKHLYDSFNAANFQDEHYMVLIYGVYNMETGILSYASGGLNTTPVLIRPDGSLQMLESEGTAICKLGEFMNPQYQNRQLLMFPGDKLVLYTDGLTEARSATGEMYALERLSSVLRRSARMEPDALTERVLADVRAFTGMDSMDDDITLLIMEVIQSF
jgi:sigma-B regulation protein RsbU (phosphoserine phosphatase)